MPDRPPSDFDDQESWMGYCVPFMMGDPDNMPNEQAVAACLRMWRDRNKKSAVPTVNRAWSVLTIKSVNGEQRQIEGLATTPTVDRIGDIVEPMGGKFMLPMPLLHQHNHRAPVGHVVAAKASKDGIAITARFAKIDEPGPLKERVDTAWQEVKHGLVSGLSIGFSPIEFEPLDAKDPWGGLRFTSWNWHELSLVTIPANAEASISVIRSLDQAASGRTASPKKASPGAPGRSSVKLNPEEPTMAKTLSEQITALEATRAAKEARMTEIMQKSVDEGRSTDEEESTEFDDLSAEVKTIDRDLQRFRVLEEINRTKAQPITAATKKEGTEQRAPGVIRIHQPDLPKGVPFARVVKALGMARGNKIEAAQIAEGLWPDDQRISNILKAAVQAGTTTDATWAGPLVSAEGAVFADFFEYLRPRTLLGKFGTDGVPSLRNVPFYAPIGTQTAGMAGYWTGEGAAKGLTRADFSRTTLTPLKVASICVVTEELLRNSALAAETLLRDELANGVAARIDTDFIDPAVSAVSGIKPASITNGVSLTNASGVTADAVRADIAVLVDAFLAANNFATNAVLIMATTTALHLSMMVTALSTPEFPAMTKNGGNIAGIPVIVSDYVGGSLGSPNSRYVWMVDAQSILFADEGGIAVDMSREASLQMDSAPTMSVSEFGSPSAPTATSVVSMFQTNSVAFRAERTVNWAKGRAEAVQGLNNVTWGT